jgi:hypothetical protein
MICRLQWRMPMVSRFFNTGAMNFVDCEKCHQPAGKVCTDHRGKKLSQVHSERAEQYRVRFKDRASLYKDGPVQIDKQRWCGIFWRRWTVQPYDDGRGTLQAVAENPLLLMRWQSSRSQFAIIR